LRFRRLEIRVRVPEDVLLRLSRSDPADDQNKLVVVLEDAGLKLARRFAPKLDQPNRLFGFHNFLYTPRGENVEPAPPVRSLARLATTETNASDLRACVSG
jgi:hypothetical protein